MNTPLKHLAFWKEKKQNIFLSIMLLSSFHAIHTKTKPTVEENINPLITVPQEDNDDTFVTEMQKLQTNIDNFQKKIMNSFHEAFDDFFNNDFFDTFDAHHTKQITQQQNQQAFSLNPQQNIHRQIHQQSSSSMSFANHEKHITITENRIDNSIHYSIEVFNKQQTKANDTNQEHDPVIELENLQDYIHNNLRAPQAVAIIQKCIQAVKQQQKNHSVNISTSFSGARQTYHIDIATKSEEKSQKLPEQQLEDAPEMENEEDKNHQSSKKKKANKFSPRTRNNKHKEEFEI